MTALRIGDVVMCRDGPLQLWSGPYVLIEYDNNATYPFRTAEESFRQCRLADDNDIPNRGELACNATLRRGDIVMCRTAGMLCWHGPFVLLAYNDDLYVVHDGHQTKQFDACRKATTDEAAIFLQPIAPEEIK